VPNFASEVDNTVGVAAIKNMMVGPIHDMKGNLKGIIQLINKNEDDAITEQDEIELNSLLISIGEIIKTADQVRLITNIATGLDVHLCNNEKIIVDTAKELEQKSMQDIMNLVGSIQDNMETLLAQKHAAFTKDKGIGFNAAALMGVLREGEKEAKKLEEYKAKEGAAEALRAQRLKEKKGE